MELILLPTPVLFALAACICGSRSEPRLRAQPTPPANYHLFLSRIQVLYK